MIVKNLIALTQGASIGDLTSLEELVSVVSDACGNAYMNTLFVWSFTWLKWIRTRFTMLLFFPVLDEWIDERKTDPCCRHKTAVGEVYNEGKDPESWHHNWSESLCCVPLFIHCCLLSGSKGRGVQKNVLKQLCTSYDHHCSHRKGFEVISFTLQFIWRPLKNHYCSRSYKNVNCSFQIFSRFWLVKTTRIIHYNKLLLTKFGKNFVILKQRLS